MFEDDAYETPSEVPSDPADRAREKTTEFRMHAELAAVFEGYRKFDARLLTGFDPQLARDVQRAMARLEKAKTPDSPVLPPPADEDAASLLDFAAAHDLPTNDYHVHRRPGEVMIVRWLSGGQVDTYYQRFQAHFDAALGHYREEERQSHGWKQDPKTLAYLSALDAIDLKMADVYLREPIRTHKAFVLSTQAADEMDILHLCDYVIGVPAAEVVGKASAPPEEPTERDRAWFFKLFSLRGMKGDMEQMCFFTFLQKSDENDW